MLQTIFYIFVVLYSVILHEISHGLAAYSMGDPTAKYAGRLTLNPIKHIDLFGSVLLPLMGYLAGGFLFGYAKPVPYNPLNLNDQRYGPAKVAAAGPLSNLLLAVLFGLFIRFVPGVLENVVLADLLGFVVYLNIGLGVFNLLPFYPLDGHHLFLSFLPDRYREVKYFLARYGVVLLIMCIFFAPNILSPLIRFLFRVIVGG